MQSPTQSIRNRLLSTISKYGENIRFTNPGKHEDMSSKHTDAQPVDSLVGWTKATS